MIWEEIKIEGGELPLLDKAGNVSAYTYFEGGGSFSVIDVKEPFRILVPIFTDAECEEAGGVEKLKVELLVVAKRPVRCCVVKCEGKTGFVVFDCDS